MISTTTLVLLGGSLAATLGAYVQWRHREQLTALAAALSHRLPAVLCALVAIVAAYQVSVVAAVALLGCFAAVVYHRWGHGASVVTRWGAASRRRHGVASTVHILRHASFAAMRRKASTVRPSIRELSRRQRARVPTTEFGVPLCRTGVLRVWASVEDVVLTFGAPRKGKSGWLAGRI
ncbi:MAG: hypothetical protein ACRDUA_19220, partial [Micromonosporaceae bacterium]